MDVISLKNSMKKTEPKANISDYMGEKPIRKAGESMEPEELMQYYDTLMGLALAKCGTQAGAEDLVSDTMLAALAYLQKGGSIAYPKTWLTNTLYHKHNDALRKKYRYPTIVCLDEIADVPEQEEDELSPEVLAQVRKELNYLGKLTREVLERFYFGRQSVTEIAEGLHIPEGTVKSRLSAGRAQMKKGLCAMETRENYLPGKMYLSFGGMEGLHGEPMSLVENDLITQNLLILAYEKPVTVSELSRAIGIPAAYIEPILQKLIDGELMVQMPGGKVYTDFLITTPEDKLKNYQPQRDFAHWHFQEIWDILEKMLEQIDKMLCVQSMGKAEQTKLERYAVLKALQDFQHWGTGHIPMPQFPNRKDGGHWYAQAVAFPAGYHKKAYEEASAYAIQGGHRTTVAVVGEKRIRLYEFDTTLWDSPHRYGFAPELYFTHILPLLWCIHTGAPLNDPTYATIPNEFIAHMPTMEQMGLLGDAEGKPCVTIPILQSTEYEELCTHIHKATETMKTVLGAEFSAFITTMKTNVPKHLTSVPELFRYIDATTYFAMSIVREAYEKELHMKDVDYCCPPVVMVKYDK